MLRGGMEGKLGGTGSFPSVRRLARPPRGLRMRTQVESKSGPSPVSVSEKLSGAELEKWENSLKIVSDLGFEDEEAEKLLARGFGWGSQAYWRKSKVDEVPEPEMIIERLEFLESVGIKGPDAMTAVSKFPEVLGCDVDEMLKPNVEYLEKKYFVKGKFRAKVILRKPKMLGNVIDCEGNCAGECSRCWAQD